MTTSSKTSKYLPVEDLPQGHQVLMTVGEQSRVKNELIAARQETALKASRQRHGLSEITGPAVDHQPE